MSSCFSSSRLKILTSATSPSSNRRAMLDPKDPVPPVTSTVDPSVCMLWNRPSWAS